jgi:anti-sigma regulatory factor (Ser/Thr protein kinase)
MLPADAASVSLARHRVASMLRVHGCDAERVDEAALLTTELATNAVEHARTPFTLMLELTDDTVRVDVRDASTSPPVTKLAPSPDRVSGRGLVLVAQLADRWGYEPAVGGKSVWFETWRR